MNILSIDFDYIYNQKKKNRAALPPTEDIIILEEEYLKNVQFPYVEIVPPMRIDAKVYLLCKYGDMTINVDYKAYHLTKGSMFRLNGQHIINDIHTSSNYRGYALIFSHDFALSVINWVPELKELVICAECFIPLIVFDNIELVKFVNIIEHLKICLMSTNHTFYSQIVKIEATYFILELADCFAKKMCNKEENTGKENRREEILRRFMHLVLDYYRQEHEVSFYATRLHMTSGNLSRVVTNASGKSPRKWIDKVLVANAKILLHNQNMNIQQVSQELNFGDQSSFGKFFRKHTGLTPIEYKNKINKAELF